MTAGRRARGEAPFSLLVYARDTSKAEELAKAFGGKAVADLASVTVDAVVSTIPGAANFELPPACLKNKPAVLDAAYKPASTALLVQAKAAGCPVAQGASMLVAQGVAQLQQWTGRVAPLYPRCARPSSRASASWRGPRRSVGPGYTRAVGARWVDDRRRCTSVVDRLLVRLGLRRGGGRARGPE